MEWLSLPGEAVDNPDQLRQIADWHACRTRIEECPKLQRRGRSQEGCPVQGVEKTAALVAVVGVVSVGLMILRRAIRTRSRP